MVVVLMNLWPPVWCLHFFFGLFLFLLLSVSVPLLGFGMAVELFMFSTNNCLYERP